MATDSQIHSRVLNSGLTLVHEEMPWLPSVSFNLLLPVGAVTDPQGFSGSAAVLYDWLFRGASQHSSQVLSETLDGLGVRRGGGAGKEFMSFSASLLTGAFSETMSLYADVLLRPHLAEEEFDFARSLAEQELASLADSPTQKLFETLSANYFASSHGNSAHGNSAGLKALDAASLRSDYSQRMAPKGAILSVAGGVTWQEVSDTAERLFGTWQGEGVNLPEVSLRPAHQEHVSQDTAQTQIGVAFKSIAPSMPNWYEHALAISVLSGGMAARLFAEVREKRGLVYSVVAVNRSVKGFGYTLAYAGTTTERAEETLEVLLHELRRLKEGVSKQEFERAKTGLLSQLIMQGESSGSRAASLARDSFLLGRPRPIDEVKTALLDLSLDDVNRYLKDRYQPEFTVLTLGAKALEEVSLT